MAIYAETSAVVAWLLDQPEGWRAFEAIRAADQVVASDLTIVECERMLRRGVASGEFQAVRAELLRGELIELASAWNLLPIGPEVVARARGTFPDELIRALDAIHLATALVARGTRGDVGLVTLDDRIRRNAVALGFEVMPA